MSKVNQLKNYSKNLKKSISELIKALIIVILIFSGLILAILLRSLNITGETISISSIVVETIAIFIVYNILKKYISIDEKNTSEK